MEEEVRTTYRPRRTVYYDAPATTTYYDPAPAVEIFPPSATDQAFHDGLWAARLEAVTVAGGAYFIHQSAFDDSFDDDEEYDDDYDEHPKMDEKAAKKVYESELKSTRALMKELKVEHEEVDPLVSAIQAPRSGRYVGRSAEDDDGDQDVVTHLTFKKDGTVEGWGDDAVDGRYSIKDGVWSTSGGDATKVLPGARVAWIEQYDGGFDVALRGQVRADGTIRAMWASTIGVSGSVDLEPHGGF